RKGGAPHPALGTARLPLTPHRVGTARGHRTGRPHHHGACSRAALVVGRAGAAPTLSGKVPVRRVIRSASPRSCCKGDSPNMAGRAVNPPDQPHGITTTSRATG